MPLDIFNTRMMVEAVNSIPLPKTFLKDTIFGKVVTSDAQYVDFDVRKSGRIIAPFVSEKVGTKTLERKGFDFKSFVPPIVGAHIITTAEDLKNRAFGENIYSPISPAARAGAMMADDLMTLSNAISRREEWMCAKLLNSGKIEMRNEDVNQEIDLTEHWNFIDIAGDPKKTWDNPEVSNPIEDIDDWQVKFAELSNGLAADIMIFGRNASKRLRASKQWVEQQKFIRTELGQFDMKMLPGGIKFLGNYCGTDLFEYHEWFLDDQDGNKSKPMIDPNKIIVASRQAETMFMYGAYFNGQMLFAIPRFPDTWVENNPKVRYLQLQSRPLPVPKNLDAFMTITVCKDAVSVQSVKNTKVAG